MVIEIIGGKGVYDKLAKFVPASELSAKLAMNESSRKARTASLANVRKTWNIKAGDLRNKTYISPATNGDLTVTFGIKSGGIPLKEFTTRRFLGLSRGEQRKRKGVSYKVKKTKRAGVLKGSFLNKSKSRGTEFVLKRDSESRYPLIPLTVVTPTHMMEESKSADVYVKSFINTFEIRFKHHLARKGGL